MTPPLFRSLDSAAIAEDIRAAKFSVCYASPGIQIEPANAMVDLAGRIGPDLITVCLDFDEQVMRLSRSHRPRWPMRDSRRLSAGWRKHRPCGLTSRVRGAGSTPIFRMSNSSLPAQ